MPRTLARAGSCPSTIRHHAHAATRWSREAGSWLWSAEADRYRRCYDVSLCDVQAVIWGAERVAFRWHGALVAEVPDLLVQQVRRGVRDTVVWTVLRLGGWLAPHELGIELVGPGWSSYGRA